MIEVGRRSQQRFRKLGSQPFASPARTSADKLLACRSLVQIGALHRSALSFPGKRQKFLAHNLAVLHRVNA
ncbi:MAG: hypothetical protein ACJ8LM_08190, partial [Candidatus Udaeobacter sp.]